MDLDQLRRRLAIALAVGPEPLGVPGPLVELTGGWAGTSVLAVTLYRADLPGTPTTGGRPHELATTSPGGA
ncbi:hypothetical protein [Quadrisphaera granulorum]|uniref:hypothetical protein n=1 Tax=Quadrisphaera granulorum TaxID=317664 RepID=UPI0011B49048|nr:hypothetical protein [Quadrisphaera granulorum]